jgi:Na+-transporting methylmalonyl-CoA/oxaloacetate decarboxylase gamma subunit
MEAEIVETVEAVGAAIDNTHILGQSVQITLIGMLILFASLFALWGIMEILVRVLKDPVKVEVAEDEAVAAAPVVVDEASLKMRAAAAAVASIQNYDLKMKAAAAAAGFAAAKKK